MNFEKTKEKLKTLVSEWGKADVYLVGGCVRDILMGLPPKDIDVCVDYPDGATVFCDYLKKNHSSCCSGFVVYPKYGTSKFSLHLDNGEEVDIECVMPRTETYNSGPRKPDQVKYTTLQEDAKRRDFCCNALYLNILSGEIIDPTGYGKFDIEYKLLRTPCDPQTTFIDDPLRMLRAFRFAAQKGFKILAEVLSGIKDYPEYYQLSQERVRDEFTKILMSDSPVVWIRELHWHGLLGFILPEFETAWGFDQNTKYHSLSLTDHSLYVLDWVIKFGADLDLRLAALLHDIGKYTCYTKKPNGSYSYPGHERTSAVVSEEILKRLKYPDKTVTRVTELIKNHMIIKPLYDRDKKVYTGTLKKTREVARKLGDNLKDEMKLIDADNRSHAEDYNMPEQVDGFWRKLVEASGGEEKKVPNLPVNGKQIMEALGLTTGNKTVGDVLKVLRGWFDEDPTQTSQQLLDRYLHEYSEKEFYVFKGVVPGVWNVCMNPVIKKPGYYTPQPFQISMETSDSCPVYNPDCDPVVKVSALHYPILYQQLTRFYKSREILSRIGKEMSELCDLPGFSGISLDLDDGGDLTGEIRWDDKKPDWII